MSALTKTMQHARVFARLPHRVDNARVFNDAISQHLRALCTGSKTTDPTTASKESRWIRLKRLRKIWYNGPNRPENRPVASFDKKAVHSLPDAIALMRSHAFAKFDESVELVFRLNVDPRHASHNLRGTLALPHGTGRNDKLALFTHDSTDGAGFDNLTVGGEDLIEKVVATKGKVLKGFAACLATSDISNDVAERAGRILGPKKLLPTTKAGTVIPASHDPDATRNSLAEFIKGKVYYRVDKFASLQMNVGKLSFDDNMLLENIAHAIEHVFRLKPPDVKRKYFKKAFISSSMGPSVLISPEDEVKNIFAERARREVELLVEEHKMIKQ